MSMHPRDYLAWCFNGTANTISEYSKAKHYELMEQQQAEQQAEYDRDAPEVEYLGTYYQHHHEQAEPVPQYQLDTDKITSLLTPTKEA